MHGLSVRASASLNVATYICHVRTIIYIINIILLYDITVSYFVWCCNIAIRNLDFAKGRKVRTKCIRHVVLAHRPTVCPVIPNDKALNKVEE